MFQPLSEVEMLAVQQEMQRRLLPAVVRATAANANLLIASLKNQNKAITATNLLQAAAALRDSIDWEVAPPKKRDVQMSPDTSRRNHAKATDDDFGESTLLRDAVAKMNLEKAKPVIAESRSLVESYRSFPHSKTYRERAALQKTFDELTAKYPNPTLKQAESIKAALISQRDGFSE
jgi:hypothetical protein